MIDYISDSEPEFELLPISSISENRLNQSLSLFSPQRRANTIDVLRSKGYTGLFESSPEPTHHNANGISIYNDENQDIDNAVLSLMPLAVGSSNSRRGLRKRNFASTHPYLADQAHWLDLASIEYLNDAYEDNQDLGSILRFLNQQYVKKKTKYPKEDRYRHKNLYVFLGRTNPNAYNGALSQSDPDVQDSASKNEKDEDSNERPLSDISEYDSDDSIVNIRHKSGLIPFSDDDDSPGRDSDSSNVSLIDITELQREYQGRKRRNYASPLDDNNSGESEPEEGIVRVGGRVRKQKNILHGVLPESAKRLEIWKGKKMIQEASRRKEPQDKRKGLAVRKTNPLLRKRIRNFINEEDTYSNLISNQDESSDADLGKDYLSLDNKAGDKDLLQVLDASSKFDSKYGNYYSVSTLSDSDSDVEIIPEIIEHSKFNRTDNIGDSLMVPPDRHEYNETLPTKVIPQKRKRQLYFHDEPEIDPDFVRKSSKYLSLKKPQTPSSGKKKSQNLGRKRNSNSVRPLKRKTFKKTSKSYKNSAPKQPREQKSQVSKEKPQVKKLGFSTTSISYVQPTLPHHPRKNPQGFTTVIEADSTRKYVKIGKFEKYSSPLNANSYSELVKLDVSLINSLKFGYLLIPIGIDLRTLFANRQFSFSLVSKQNSIKEANSLLLQLARTISNPSNDIKELENPLTVLLGWYLTLQELPSEKEWRYLGTIAKHLGNDNEACPTVYSLVIALYFSFLKLSERYEVNIRSKYDEFKDICGTFWWIIFKKLDVEVDSEVLLQTDELFRFMWKLLSSDVELFWLILNKISQNTLQENALICLGGLFYVSNKLPSKFYDWECFYSLYRESGDASSCAFHKDFLDVCFLLNQRKSWPLEEKLILLLYSTITARRFFNFEDEHSKVSILTRIHTFHDIPSSSFFEKFLQFLYYYVSSLTDISSSKRLATKLLTSSHYQYDKGRRYQDAFLNRFNFIILMSQLSPLSQNKSVTDLVSLISDSNDIEMYLIAIQGLKSHSEIALERRTLLVEPFALLLNRISSLYMKIPGVSKILIQYTILLKRVFVSNFDYGQGGFQLAIKLLQVFDRIAFRSLHDDIITKLIDLLIPATQIVISNPDVKIKSRDIVLALIENLRTMISNRMGSFPMKTRVKEERSISLIEQSLKLWVTLSSVVNPNWNKIIFQEFPYMGNSYLRNMFALCLFCYILEFDNLSRHLDVIFEYVLKLLAQFHQSKYVTDVINALKRFNLPIFDLRKINLNRRITSIDLNTNKAEIVITILSNIISDSRPKQSKLGLIGAFLEALNEEYDKYFKSSRFVEFCKRSVEHILVDLEFMSKLDVYRELENKLNITPVSINQLKWKNLPKVEKLSLLHKEIISSIVYEKQISLVFDQYIQPSSIDSLFHLVSIYLKNILNNHFEYWMLVSMILDYLVLKLNSFYICVANNRDFARFVLLLGDLASFRNSRWGSRFTNVLKNYQLNSICQAFNILKMAYFLFEGFKDHSFIIEVIKEASIDYSCPGMQITELRRAYSSFNIHDISPNRKELLPVIEELILKPDHEKYDPDEYMSYLERLIEEEEPESSRLDEQELHSILDFEFVFQ